ncbi:MAG: PadR family transcriptional regulator [Bifidobacteriaceae bacterium]|jgi:PadR family transcriptional regulator PadR|nr:PadR family transcriptional regulator [Bifidobacteriaceae bacterium]
MLKGVLPLLILDMLRRADAYGYELVGRIHAIGLPSVTAGTVYPLITRLERDGLAESYLRQSQTGPARKYYRITSAGRAHLAQAAASWDHLARVVDAALRAPASAPPASSASPSLSPLTAQPDRRRP